MPEDVALHLNCLDLDSVNLPFSSVTVRGSNRKNAHALTLRHLSISVPHYSFPPFFHSYEKKKKNSFLRQTSVCVSYMIILSISTLFHTLIPLLGKKGEVRRTSPIFNNMTVDDKQKLCRHSGFFCVLLKANKHRLN